MVPSFLVYLAFLDEVAVGIQSESLNIQITF